MATVLKLAHPRAVASILLDLRSVSAEIDRCCGLAKSLDDDDLAAWDRLDDRAAELRAELDAAMLEYAGVGLDQIREAIGC